MQVPLLEDTKIAGSRRILINITGSSALGLHEVNEACTIVREAASCDDVQINFGVIANDAMGDAVKVTVIATGFQLPEVREEIFFMPVKEQATAPKQETAAAPEAERTEEQEPLFIDPDDLDVPAYLRNNGKLLN